MYTQFGTKEQHQNLRSIEMNTKYSRRRPRQPRPFENRTAVLADVENLARGTVKVAKAMDDIARLIARTAPAELGPRSVIYSCERSVFNESSQLWTTEWRWVTPMPDPDGKNGADNALALELEFNQLVHRSQRTLILGGDGRLVQGARDAVDRGSLTYLVALEGSLNPAFRTIPGLIITEIPDLGSI